MILSEDDTSIAFDPFCGLQLRESLHSKNLSPGGQEFRKIEHVFITHGHFDHMFYEVLCADKRIQIMGSLNLSAEVEYPTGADMLILPFQGRSDLEKCGLSIVRRLKPKKFFLIITTTLFRPFQIRSTQKNLKGYCGNRKKLFVRF